MLNTIEKRKQCLCNLIDLLTDNEEDCIKALFEDLHKGKEESLLCEILSVKKEISMLIENIDLWTRETQVEKSFITYMDKSSIQLQPLGTVLAICPFNYPIYLSFLPLAGAIAAGNRVVLKLSELAPATEKLISELIPKYIDEKVCQVIVGGPEKTIELLNETRFDLIFFTGSTNVARSIMAQAAKFLTPVVFELGGKSPVYVDKSVNLKVVTKRLCWAKCINAGQTCVAPDYVLCHEDILDEFIEMCKDHIEEFFGNEPKNSPDFCRIINSKHFDRLKDLLKTTKGKIIIGGEAGASENYIAPTIVKDVDISDSLMQEEIFGPILPVITVASSTDAISIVNRGEAPLAIYVFSSDYDVQNAWKTLTTSGSLVYNECILQLADPYLPFGGVGHSGMGRYKGLASIQTFSNPRSICNKSPVEIFNNKFRYPPYDGRTISWARWLLSSRSESRCSIM